GVCRLGLGVLLAEALHAAGGVDQLLLASEERMAGGADIEVDFSLSAAGLERISARAADLRHGVNGMDFGLHFGPQHGYGRAMQCSRVEGKIQGGNGLTRN